MRVLVAPDCFTGTLDASAAAAAVAAGWRRTAPDDEVDPAGLSDGGPGFLDVLHAALGGDLRAVEVPGPLGAPVRAGLLLVGPTAYVESAQACGLHLVGPADRDPRRTTTLGVGRLVAAAVDAGARRVVVGLGGSGTVDAGAGLLAGLGARAAGADGADATALLAAGGGALPAVARLDLAPARERLAGVELVAASDVDSPLLGPDGAARGFGPQKGASPRAVEQLEAALAGFAAVAVGEPLGSPRAADAARAPGAGAAGGLGLALALLGARREPGAALVCDAVGLDARAAAADLVLTGEGSFDWQSLRGKVVAEVAARAGAHGVPVVVLAGRVGVGRRDRVAAGVAAAFSVADDAGSVEAAMAAPAARLADLAARVARTWSR